MADRVVFLYPRGNPRVRQLGCAFRNRPGNLGGDLRSEMVDNIGSRNRIVCDSGKDTSSESQMDYPRSDRGRSFGFYRKCFHS